MRRDKVGRDVVAATWERWWYMHMFWHLGRLRAQNEVVVARMPYCSFMKCLFAGSVASSRG